MVVYGTSNDMENAIREIIALDRLVPIAEEHLIHVRNVVKRPICVLNDVRVPEMGIRDDVTLHGNASLFGICSSAV